MLLCAPLLAGWAVFALSQGNIWMLYLGRILQGLGVMSSVTQVHSGALSLVQIHRDTVL